MLLELFEDAGGATGIPVLPRYMQAPVHAGGMGKEQSCGPALPMSDSSSGHSKEGGKSPWRVITGPSVSPVVLL